MVMLIVAACSAVAFVGSNPSLWPDPVRETVRGVRARVEVTKAQVRLEDERGLPALSDRLRVVPGRVFSDDAVVPIGWPGTIFFAAGAIATILELRRWLRSEQSNHALVVLSVIGLTVSVPSLFTPLDRPRFFMLPVFFFSFPTVLGLVWAASWLWQRAWSMIRPAR